VVRDDELATLEAAHDGPDGPRAQAGAMRKIGEPRPTGAGAVAPIGECEQH